MRLMFEVSSRLGESEVQTVTSAGIGICALTQFSSSFVTFCDINEEKGLKLEAELSR